MCKPKLFYFFSQNLLIGNVYLYSLLILGTISQNLPYSITKDYAIRSFIHMNDWTLEIN